MNDDQLDLIFKALSDGTRRRIIEHLGKKTGLSLFEVCAVSIAEDGSALSRQTIFQHLDVLNKAGLIETTWKGRTKLHSLNINETHLNAFEWLEKYLPKGNAE